MEAERRDKSRKERVMELQFEKIEKSYQDKKVLKGISVTMGTGVYGLLGPNGAGKTTMIRIMAIFVLGLIAVLAGFGIYHGQKSRTVA